jgi:hypothetical protein
MADRSDGLELLALLRAAEAEVERLQRELQRAAERAASLRARADQLRGGEEPVVQPGERDTLDLVWPPPLWAELLEELLSEEDAQAPEERDAATPEPARSWADMVGRPPSRGSQPTPFQPASPPPAAPARPRNEEENWHVVRPWRAASAAHFSDDLPAPSPTRARSPRPKPQPRGDALRRAPERAVARRQKAPAKPKPPPAAPAPKKAPKRAPDRCGARTTKSVTEWLLDRGWALSANSNTLLRETTLRDGRVLRQALRNVTPNTTNESVVRSLASRASAAELELFREMQAA